MPSCAVKKLPKLYGEKKDKKILGFSEKSCWNKILLAVQKCISTPYFLPMIHNIFKATSNIQVLG